MAIRSDEITSIIKSATKASTRPPRRTVGTVVEVGDGIAQIYGLDGALSSELLEFPNGVRGMALNLEEETVGASSGDANDRGRRYRQDDGQGRRGAAGQALLAGSDPLGRPLDDKARSIREDPAGQRIAPGVSSASRSTRRSRLIKAIDALIPISAASASSSSATARRARRPSPSTRYQPEGQRPVCIYVAIGQKPRRSPPRSPRSRSTARWSTRSSSSPGRGSRPAPVPAPYSGVPSARRSWRSASDRRAHRQDALCVYDDLSKHAWAYREMSLVLPARPRGLPGRRVLLPAGSRAGGTDEHRGGGSLTAPPTIETGRRRVGVHRRTPSRSPTARSSRTDLRNAGQRPA